MATAVQVVESTVPMPPPSGIEHHLRRSTRIRSSPPRPFITVRGSNVDSPSSHGQRSSRSGSSRSRPASHASNASLPSINSKLLLTAAVNPGSGSHSKAKGLPETELLPPPKSESLPRTASKRRRGSDLTERLTDLDEQCRTPRALRALKRQRLSHSESCDGPQGAPNKSGSTVPLSVDKPGSIDKLGSKNNMSSPLGSVENQNHRVSPNKVDNDPDVRTTDESDAAGILENLVPFRKEETRKHFDSDYPISGKVVNSASSVSGFESREERSDSSSSADSLDASTPSTHSASREQDYSTTSVNTPVISDTTSEFLSIFNSRDASAPTPDSENIHPTYLPARAPTPAPTPIDLPPPTPPPLPSPLSQPALFPLAETGLAHALPEDPDLLEVPPAAEYPVTVPLPVRQRARKPETCDINIWKLACKERVNAMMRRFHRENVQAVVATQAARFTPTRFHLYTPASYTEADEDLTGMDDVLMDDDDDFEWDDDGSDDENDFPMGMDETTTDGFDVMDVTTPEESSRQHPTEGDSMQGVFNEYGQHGPQSPHLPIASFSTAPPAPPPPPPPPIPQFPRLSSIRVRWLEPCPLLTPDGRSYMGRGTPIDRVRRADWANIRPVYRSNPWEYTLSQEDWFSIFSLAPSAPSTSNTGVPLMPDLPYGVPGAAGPLCCTEQGTFGVAGPMLPSFEPMEGLSTDVSHQSSPPLPTPHGSWLDPSLGVDVPAAPASHVLGPVRADPSPFVSPHYTTTPSPESTHNQTGCAWHSSFLQCLLASGIGCSPCASSSPADNSEASSSSTADTSVVLARTLSYNTDRVPVQVSSTLSHALG